MSNTSYLKIAARMLVVSSLFLAGTARAEAEPDRVSVKMTDPSRPAYVKLSLLNGGITVKAHQGNEVVVEARIRTEEHEPREGKMRRVPMTSTGLSVDADNNEVHIGVDSTNRTIDVTVLVPVHTSLYLRTVNDGDISVTGVDGDIDVDDVNGEVTLKDISGSAVAHALNGQVLVNFEHINPSKAMAFSSLNGNIDVTFPADLKANLSMTNDQGEVYSDFDIQVQSQAPKQIVDDGSKSGGRYRVRVDKTVHGTINGGGQEIQFKGYNGDIFIRKAGAK